MTVVGIPSASKLARPTCSASWSRWSRRTSSATSRWPRSGSRTSTCRGARAATSTACSAARPGSPSQSKMSDVARTSLIVNLLTEDNLPELPPRDRHRLRPGRRVGHLGAPVDRRGRPARDRDPRLPARHPGGRPGGAGAGPDDAHGRRLRVGQPRRPAAVAGVRLVPGAGHPHLAPQHRQDHPRPDRATSCSPASRWTRTCTCSSTATCWVPRWRSRRARRCGRSPRS